MVTVADLARVGELGLHFMASRSGGHKDVVWVKSGDRPNPWSEVAGGDVLVVDYAGFPSEARGQRAWIQASVHSGASALVIAGVGSSEDGLAKEALAEAQHADFPVLGARADFPVLHTLRAVVSAAIDAERRLLDQADSVFAAMATAARLESDFSRLIEILGEHFGVEIEPSSVGLGKQRQSSNESDTTAIGIPGPIGGVLSATSPSGGRTSFSLARHLAGVIGVELSKQALQRDLKRARGAEIFRSLIHRSAELPMVEAELSRRALTGDRVVICLHSGDKRKEWDSLHHDPVFHSFDPLIVRDGDRTLVLTTLSEDLPEGLCMRLTLQAAMGVSAIIGVEGDVPEAVRQARAALENALESGRQLVRYGERLAAAGELLPSDEDKSMVESLLGELMRYDDAHGSELVLSLSTFLENDRSWKVSAAKLGIHRQTLVYRLRLVEQMTGYRPNSTIGVAKLWLAIETGRRSGLVNA